MATAEQGAVKISLESLGMTLSNVLPQFILNKEEAGPMQKSALGSLQKSFVFVSENGGEESGSIVVLGKSSLEEIQAQSLASFHQIQRKSLAMDCKSIISSLTPPEVEKKLTEVLQENLRLKETLEQNNVSMKEHLNMLVTRQEELNKVHEAHRLKFAETKNLVNLLKAENNELKTKVESQEKEGQEELNKVHEAHRLKFEETKNLVNVLEAENNELKSKVESQEKEGQERSTQTDKESKATTPKMSPETFDSAKSTETIKLAELCKEQCQEIARLNEITSLLKQELKLLYEQPLASLSLTNVASLTGQCTDSYRQQFLTSFTHYNEKLETLGNCYAAQTSRYTSIQECLQRCSEILTDKHNSVPASEESRQCLESEKRKELQTYRSKLIDEELKSIAERQDMIKAQNEFQKIFTDYNSTLLELESLRKERERLPTLQRGADLHDERLDEAKASLRESERLLDEQRRGLEYDRRLLAEHIQTIERERFCLRDEQRKLVAANEALNKQECELVNANAALNEEASSVRESNEVLREQLKVYESEFEEEVKLRKTILSERNELIDHVRKLEEEKSRYMRLLSQGEPN